MRVLYRVRQFWRTLFFITDKSELEQARGRLNAAQWALFSQMQSPDQNHALSVFHKLLDQGEEQPDLLIAALLHDVGKVRYHLNPFHRAMVVLVKAVKPELAQYWGQVSQAGWEALPGWRKAFIVTEQHPKWGAEMARACGVTPLAVTLISLHQHPQNLEVDDTLKSLLNKLWVVDNDS